MIELERNTDVLGEASDGVCKTDALVAWIEV
jgi:hypothetical protein